MIGIPMSSLHSKSMDSLICTESGINSACSHYKNATHCEPMGAARGGEE